MMTIMMKAARHAGTIIPVTATNRPVKTRTIIGLGLAAALAGVAGWWLNAAKRGPTIPSPTKLSGAATAGADATLPADPDPRSELKTAIPDIVRLLEANDFATYLREYMPPDKLAAIIKETKLTFDQIVAKAQTDPAYQQQAVLEVAILKTLGGVIPAVNAAGDEATYPINPANFTSYATPGGPRIPSAVAFVKIAGQWHLITE